MNNSGSNLNTPAPQYAILRQDQVALKSELGVANNIQISATLAHPAALQLLRTATPCSSRWNALRGDSAWPFPPPGLGNQCLNTVVDKQTQQLQFWSIRDEHGYGFGYKTVNPDPNPENPDPNPRVYGLSTGCPD
ncbi:hypothetical protein B0H11DRAFT_1941442 [Mycena galericulata]|nr:hypothetical protein B0H11DRAFT_1941442 [Mycena galericulata]